MSIEQGNSKSEFDKNLLKILTNFEEIVRWGVALGASSREDYITRSRRHIEIMEEELGIETALLKLADRLGADRKQLEREFSFISITKDDEFPRSSLHYCLKYKEVFGKIGNPRYGPDLIELLGPGGLLYDSWWEKLELDLGYRYYDAKVTRSSFLSWDIRATWIHRIPYLFPYNPNLGFQADDMRSEIGHLWFPNNPKITGDINSEFQALIEKMYQACRLSAGK